MSLYIDENTLSDATARLSASRAQSTLADYLVFKRALVLAKAAAAAAGKDAPEAVVTGTASVHFAAAIEQVTAIDPGGVHGWTGSPYFSPFGASRDSGKGYKSAKFPSNGSSDTANRWQSRPTPPVQLDVGSKPRAFKVPERTGKELVAFFHVGDEQRPKPALLDVAVWWFRAEDLDTRFASQPSDQELVDAFVEDVGLTQDQIEGLFEPLVEGAQDGDV